MNKKAFTLLEVIIAVIIIAIVATFTWPQYIEFKEKSIAQEAVYAIGLHKINIEAQLLYGSDSIADIPPLKHWEYGGITITADLPPSRAEVSYFRKDGPFAGTRIRLRLNMITKTATWDGDHPGVPSE